jgi:hypothetical protein
MRRWRALLLAALWALAACAHAQPREVRIAADESYPLSKAFAYLEDRDGRLTIDDVAKPQAQAAFRPVPQVGPAANFGLTRSAIWLRVVLKADRAAAPDWLLEIAYPPLDRLELYSPAPGGGWQKQVGGDAYPFDSRVIPHRDHVLPLRLVPGSDSTLYLRIQSEGTVAAPATLWQPAALWRQDQATYAALSLYFGLLVGLLLYNLLLFVSVRDTAYLIYAAFAASMAIGQAALTGLASSSGLHGRGGTASPRRSAWPRPRSSACSSREASCPAPRACRSSTACCSRSWRGGAPASLLRWRCRITSPRTW